METLALTANKVNIDNRSMEKKKFKDRLTCIWAQYFLKEALRALRILKILMEVLDIYVQPKQSINYIEEHQGLPHEGEQCAKFMLSDIKIYCQTTVR